MPTDPQGRPAGSFLGDVAAIVIDAAGTIDVAEGSAVAALGIPESSVGRPIRDVLAHYPTLLRGLQRALTGHAERLAIEVDNRSFELCIEPRRAGGAVAAAAEVTALRRAERDRQELERYFDRIFQQAPGGVWATDRELRITYARGRVMALRGIDPRRVVGMRVEEFVGSRDPTEPALARHRAALAGERQSFRYELRGRLFHVLIEPLFEGDGSVSGCVGAAVDMTDVRRVEEELAALGRRLAEAQRVAHIGSFEWDVATNRVTWSDELHRIYGLEPGTFAGTYESFIELTAPGDMEHTRTVVFEALRNAKPFSYDHRIRRPGGAVRVLHTEGDVVPDERGRALRVIGCCWDVTDLRESIEKRERARSLLEATFNATADGLLVVDREGHATAYNDRLLELWKLSRHDLASMDFESLMHRVHPQLANPDECVDRVQELAALPGADSFDALRFRDGRFFERYSRPQRIGDEIVGRVWSYRDVTDREHLLRRAVFLADASRLLASLEVEPALDAVAHLALPLLGDGCVVDILDDGGPRRLIAVSRDPARPLQVEVRAQTLAGHSSIQTVGHCSYMAVPLIVKGNVIGAITFVAAPAREHTSQDLDLAEELACRVALSVANARLYRGTQEALHARDEVLSIAAHEIRGPVTSMHLAVQGLHRGVLPPAARGRVLEIIEREDARIGQFVSELLDVGRIRAGHLRFELEEVDLGEVVREVGSHLGAELTRSGSSLSISAVRAVGQWDRFRLEQVVTNLLANAIHFGLGKPIAMTVSASGGRATLVVKDNGMGVSEEAQARIFGPFERAVSSRHFGGLGLGLYIVRTIVEGLGGHVSVESRPGAGATFRVELPQARTA